MRAVAIGVLTIGLGQAGWAVPLLLFGCQDAQSPTAPKDEQGCFVNTEHDCAGGGCCWNGYVCGGAQPDVFTTCADGYCCDEEENPQAPQARRRVKQRRP